MQENFLSRVGFGVVLLISVVAACRAQQPPTEWKQVEAAMGRSGQLQPGDVMKFSLPRSDLRVTVAGTQIKPGLALGSWVAFKKMGVQAMAMGDLVLTESEVGPVMKRLEDGGVQITALHNHLLNESPRVMYMHIMGRGKATNIAHVIASALLLTRTPPGAPATVSGKPETTDLDIASIEKVLGRKGKLNGGLLQFSVPRAEKITDDGMEVPRRWARPRESTFNQSVAGALPPPAILSCWPRR